MQRAEVEESTLKQRELLEAAAAGDAAGVRRVLDRRPHLRDCCTDDGKTVLMHAVCCNSLRTVRAVLGSNPDIGRQMWDNSTAASSCLSSRMLRELLDEGADPNERDFEYTLLHRAAMWGYRKKMKVLIDFGADLDCFRFHQWSPLMYACTNGEPRAIRLLLRRGANKCEALDAAVCLCPADTLSSTLPDIDREISISGSISGRILLRARSVRQHRCGLDDSYWLNAFRG